MCNNFFQLNFFRLKTYALLNKPIGVTLDGSSLANEVTPLLLFSLSIHPNRYYFKIERTRVIYERNIIMLEPHLCSTTWRYLIKCFALYCSWIVLFFSAEKMNFNRRYKYGYGCAQAPKRCKLKFQTKFFSSVLYEIDTLKPTMSFWWRWSTSENLELVRGKPRMRNVCLTFRD